MSAGTDPIKEKIKKLLRMKRGGTPAEIETALAMAAELARKHGIDLASCDPDEQSEQRRISHVSELLKSRMPAEARFAAAILVNFFNLQILIQHHYRNSVWRRQWTVHLIGTTWDCEIGKYVFAFLQCEFRRAWNRRANRRLKNRYAFLNGMFLGLAAKLEEQRKVDRPGQALVLLSRGVQLRNDYVKEHWPNSEDCPLEKDDSNALASRLAGIEQGQKTEIRPALNGSGSASRPALPPPAGQLALL